MEFLVTITTHVPAGTPPEAVDDVRSREAARSRDLARQGHELRLWRPPLQPGEWRTLGLFAADDAAQLEEVLASMPLRIWRTDEVTPLGRHGNDPGRPQNAATRQGTEYFSYFTLTVPDGTPEGEVERMNAAEHRRTAELGEQGHLFRLWTLPADGEGRGRALGLWQAADHSEMETVLGSLPMHDWLLTEVVALGPHPSDPAAATA